MEEKRLSVEYLMKPRYRKADVSNYFIIHQWIIKNYGRAVKCESHLCNKKSQNYEWALVKGCAYEKDISHFKQLCVSCHRIYDMTHEKIMNQSIAQQKRTNETRDISGLIYDKTGSKNFSAKKVIDISNGRVYETLKEAATENNLNMTYLCGMLKGNIKNKTTLKYYDNK